MEIERKSERISLTLRYVPSLDIKTNLNVNQTDGERKDGNESGESVLDFDLVIQLSCRSVLGCGHLPLEEIHGLIYPLFEQLHNVQNQI